MTIPSAVIAKITSGAAVSAEIDLGDKTLLGIAMPAAWDAAHLTFQVSVDGGVSFQEMFTSAAAAVDITVAASQYFAIDPAMWRGVNCLKLRSGTLAVPVNQTADRLITLVTKPVM